MWLRIRKIDGKEIAFGLATEQINLREHENGIFVPKEEYYDVFMSREECKTHPKIRIYDSWNPHLEDSPKRTEIIEIPKTKLELKVEDLQNQINALKEVKEKI